MRAIRLLSYLYLCRFSLLTVALLFALPWAGLTFLSPILGGTFELQPGAIFWVSLIALMTAETAMVTWRLVFLYGRERFFDETFRTDQKDVLRWSHLIIFASFATPLIGAAVWCSDTIDTGELNLTAGSSMVWWQRLGPALLAFPAAYALLLIAALLRRFLSRPNATGRGVPHLLLPSVPATLRPLFSRAERANPMGWLRDRVEVFLSRVPAWLGRGYITDPAHELLPGHGLAAGLFGAAALVYGVVGFLPGAPALAYVLLLIMLGTWLLAGMAFFLDRYRLPVFLPLAGLIWMLGWFPASDHFYRALPGTSVNPLPRAVVLAPLDDAPPGSVSPPKRVILVAANGGGIQAAAWTARVLTGLEEASRLDQVLAGRKQSFGESVRFISGVSGGSVGAFYFAGAYDREGHLPAGSDLEKVAAMAARSSLDEVSKGLAFSDLGHLIIPFVGDPFADRAEALERAWAKGCPSPDVRLSDWRADVLAGHRPAVIFNATVAETGERRLFGTTDTCGDGRGRQNFDRLQNHPDLFAVTAARLSATFPYVTPAARAEAEPGRHIVDGGYYDNYGMTTLMEWLNEALRDAGPALAQVLVIQIRGAPEAGTPAPVSTGPRGFLFQLAAPLRAMLAVREAAQASHNDTEFQLLLDRWDTDLEPKRIQTVTFTFDPGKNHDAQGGKTNGTPLSWHLTHQQKLNLQAEWERQQKGCGCVEVLKFLRGG